MQVSIGDRIISFFTYLVYSIFAFVCVYPFYYILINSISANNLSERGKVLFWPLEIHFTNYVNVLKIPTLFDALKVSVARTVVGTALTSCSRFPGYMFTRETLGWKFWYRFVVVTMYFNAVSSVVYHHDEPETTNNFGDIYVGSRTAFLCRAVQNIRRVDPEGLQAAEIDGAGTLTIFYKVMLPVIKPILATIAIFAAVAQWNSFQDTLLLMTDSKLYTLQFVLYQYINQANSLRGLINNASGTIDIAASLAKAQTATSIRMTVTIIVVTPIILVYPFFQRFFVKGIMIGAVKG